MGYVTVSCRTRVEGPYLKRDGRTQGQTQWAKRFRERAVPLAKKTQYHPTKAPASKLRLLIITFDPPQNVGGVEGRAVGYVRQLSKTKNFVEIASFSPDSKPSVEPFLGTSRIHRLASNITSLPSALGSIVGTVRSKQIDTVFFLSGGITLHGNLLLLYCRLLGIRTAIFLYGKDILQSRGSYPGRLLLATSQLLANRVAVNSRFTSTLLGHTRNVQVLYPSVDPSIEGLSPSQASRDTVLFVGRLVERKGMKDLLDALTLLKDEVPAVKLEVVGNGPERASLERMTADLGVSGRVTFFGELRGKEHYRRYAMCTVFAMPSRTMKDDVEGFGTVFLEAGLFGKPSVGTMSGGIPEAVLDGVTGILVKEGDVASLAKALKTLLQDRELSKKFGNNAKRRVLQEFTWERGTDKLAGILGGR